MIYFWAVCGWKVVVYVSSRGWQSAHDPFNNEINGRLLSIIPFRRGGACPFFRLSNDRQHNQIMFFNSFLSSLTTKTGESNKIKWKIGRKGGSRNSLFFSSSRRTQKKGWHVGKLPNNKLRSPLRGREVLFHLDRSKRWTCFLCRWR